MTRRLTLEHVKDICFVYAQTHLAFDEPIPPFETRFPSKLEAILEIPRQGVGGKPFYPTVTEQAAVLFYSLVKEHPFLNGNKRIAIISLLTFLLLNGRWLRIDLNTLYKTTLLVAKSDPKEREHLFTKLDQLIKKSLITTRPGQEFASA